MRACNPRTLRNAFASSIHFLQCSFVSICSTYLKWQHCRLNDLVICSQAIILGISMSSLNICVEENGISNNRFRIAVSTWSSDGLLGLISSSIETRLVLDSQTQCFTETEMYISLSKPDVSSGWILAVFIFLKWRYLIIVYCSSSIQDENCWMCWVSNVYFRY
jgi:hypothetical protein